MYDSVMFYNIIENMLLYDSDPIQNSCFYTGVA